MLTIKENLMETIKKGGHPDRFVEQWEFIEMLFPDLYYMGGSPRKQGDIGVDQFGVYWAYPEGQMGSIPLHDDEHRLLKDITEWREVVRRPVVPEDPGYWEMLKGMAADIRARGKLAAALQVQGIFERLHSMMGMEDAMVNFYEEPEEMQELIEFLTDIELEFAKNMVERVGVDAVLHHDDWGSGESTFFSPAMFAEFLAPAYQKIYGYYKEHGVLVIHHNDGYGATLVPQMIEMGVDIWQGVLPSNDVPALVEKYGDKITFMGGIATSLLDVPDWTPEAVAAEVHRAMDGMTPHGFIPCLTAGLAGGHFPGVYEAVSEEIRKINAEMQK